MPGEPQHGASTDIFQFCTDLVVERALSSRQIRALRGRAASLPSMPTARVNGITMYYEQHGAGEPLLLINGLGADITLLAPIVAWFARSDRGVAFGNRGAGRSDKPDAPYTIELMAKDTAALMDVLSLGRVNVLGISMGGRIALE